MASSLAFLGWLLVFRSSPVERRLRATRAETDAAAHALNPGFNNFVRRAHLPDGTELGVVQFAQGGGVKFWFRSHHLEHGNGTLLETMDGATLFVTGCFCCEVMLNEQPRHLADLYRVLARCDGKGP